MNVTNEQARFELGLLMTRLKVLDSYLRMTHVTTSNVDEFDRQVHHYINRIEQSMFRVLEVTHDEAYYSEMCLHIDAARDKIENQIYNVRCGLV